MIKNDSYWMQKALDLALAAKEHREVPIGAVLISAEGKCVGRGWNQVIGCNDPTAHAEMVALREAGRKLGNYRLNGTTLYSTLEPCCMCAGALIHARVARLVFAARDFKTGAAGSIYNLLNSPSLNHQIQIDEGVFEQESSALLANFFKVKRSPP